ncbi:MAG: ankyrin repeat domain-containing protein [Parashewanella sp.]
MSVDYSLTNLAVSSLTTKHLSEIALMLDREISFQYLDTVFRVRLEKNKRSEYQLVKGFHLADECKPVVMAETTFGLDTVDLEQNLVSEEEAVEEQHAGLEMISVKPTVHAEQKTRATFQPTASEVNFRRFRAELVDRLNQGQQLITAVQNGKYDKASQLIEETANISYCDSHGNTALHYACRYQDTKCIQLLLDAGADIEAKNNDGYTPLMFASRCKNSNAVRLLISHNANCHAKNEQNHTPFNIACDNQDDEIAELIAQCNVDTHIAQKSFMSSTSPLERLASPFTTFSMLAAKGRTSLLIAYIEYYQRNNIPCSYTTAFKLAIDNNQSAALQCLTENTDAHKWRDVFGQTPLMIAMQQRKSVLVLILLPKDESLYLTDENKNTALHHLFLGVQPPVTVEFVTPILQNLKKSKIDWLLPNKKKQTPLDLLIKTGNEELLRACIQTMAWQNQAVMMSALLFAVVKQNNVALLETVISLSAVKNLVNSQNKQGDTVLHLAVKDNKIELIKSLVNLGASENIKNHASATALNIAKSRMKSQRGLSHPLLDALIAKNMRTSEIDEMLEVDVDFSGWLSIDTK